MTASQWLDLIAPFNGHALTAQEAPAETDLHS